jgi:hypothetical protein
MSGSILTIVVFAIPAVIVLILFLLKQKREVTLERTRPWMRYSGMVTTGDPRSSQRIDEVIYGRKD